VRNIDLVRLQEECAEVIQIISKIQRFGASAKGPKHEFTAYERLLREVADVQVCIDNLKLPKDLLKKYRKAKRSKLLFNSKFEII
jgi:hypothetical protein